MTPTNALFFDGVVSLLGAARKSADWETYGDLLETLADADIGVIASDDGHILAFDTLNPRWAR